MLKFTAKILFFSSMLLASAQAAAALITSLYDVEIPVIDESADARNLAFERGLDQVFVRLSGDSIIMDKLKRPPAKRYIKQFSYEPLDNTTGDLPVDEDGEVLTHLLKVQYNGSLIKQYLLENGFPVWGEYRPDVIVWLLVSDGRNQYVLKESDRSLLKSVAADAMTRRGIPARWPVYDFTDKAALNVADIRGGFREPVMNASQRYATDTVLTGTMSWNGNRWQSSWNLFVEDEVRHWSQDNPDYTQLINKVIDQAADILGLAFAVHSADTNRQLATIQIDIQGINSIDKYRYVESYLSGLSAVEYVMPDKVEGQNAVFTVSLRSNEEDFVHLIKNDAELIELRSPQTSTPPVITEIITESVTEAGSASKESLETTGSEQLPAETIEDVPLKQMPIYYYRLDQH